MNLLAVSLFIKMLFHQFNAFMNWTIASLFKARMVDRYSVFVGGLIIGGANAPTPCDGDGWVAENGIKLELKDFEVLGNGALLTFEPRYE